MKVAIKRELMVKISSILSSLKEAECEPESQRAR